MNIGLDLSEIAIDQFINEGLLKDIPIVNTVLALFKAGTSIKDALYIKKLLLFIGKVQEVSKDKRVNFLKEISVIVEEKNRLFEKILGTIDKLDDSAKALLLGKIFKHLIVGNINLIQYYRITRVIEDMMLDEINYFFYKHGYFEHNDETREKYYFYSDIIGEDNLKSIMIKNELFEVKEELKFSRNIRPQEYRIEKKENLTKLGELFAEFGFESRYYLQNPI